MSAVTISRLPLPRSFGFCGTLDTVYLPALLSPSAPGFASLPGAALLVFPPSAFAVITEHMYHGLRSGVGCYSWYTRLSSYPTRKRKSENCKDVGQKVKNISISHRGSESLCMPKSFTMLSFKRCISLCKHECICHSSGKEA